MTDERTRSLYEELLRGSALLAKEQRWTVLMAAHVVGQPLLALHWDSHVRMLRLAWQTRDWREVAGQLLRLALVPVGHAAGRLPKRNV